VDCLLITLWRLSELVTLFRKPPPAGNNIVGNETRTYSERRFRMERRAIWTKHGL